jgi:hypothetical protein
MIETCIRRPGIPLAVALVALSASAGTAQTKKPAPKKPAPPKSAPPKKPAAAGTAQLPGENGKLGTIYGMGKDGRLYFTLNSAEFTVKRVNIGETMHAPSADEKLLLLNFSIQNATPGDLPVDWATLRFTAVDSQNQNRVYPDQVAKSGTGEVLGLSLKPAQKIDAYTLITVPADASVPKLMVQHVEGGGVLRYDLKGQAKGLQAPFAEPTDPTGMKARPVVEAAPARYYPMKALDVQFVSGAYVSGPLGEHEPGEGKRFFVATLTLKNASPTPFSYNWGSIAPRWLAADDEKSDYNQVMLKKARNELADGELKPGEETTVRIFAELPRDLAMKTLYVSEEGSREYAFDVSSIK